MGIGTFGSFTQARLAIYAAQSGLTVTGNNISNINTEGYTRQRLDQESLYIGGADRYVAKYDLRIGQGVLATGVSQLRDPYLDIRYRSEMAKVGYMDTTLGGLEGIADILDEVGKGEQTEGEGFGIIASQIEAIKSALNALTTQTGHQEFDIQVRSAAQSLCLKLNSYATKLQQHYNNVEKAFVTDVSEVNTILTSIRDLNESIRNSEIHGNKALELRDERNLLIDKLSEYMQIDVVYTPEDIGGGEWVEKCTIKLGDANPDPSVKTDSTVLIDGIFGSQISIDQAPQLRELDLNDPTTFPYLDEDGNPTARLSEAKKYTRNPNYDPDITDVTDPKYGQYMKADNTGGTNDIEEAAYTLRENEDYVPYLKEDGTPTSDPKEARQVNSPNFNLTVSELRDARDNLLYYTDAKTEKVQETEYQEALKGENGRKLVDEVKNPNGVITITVYGQTGSGNNRTYFKRTYTKTPSESVELDDNDIYGALQAERELLTEKGEFTDLEVIQGTGDATGVYRNADESASTKRGIQYYQRSLDLLANQIAKCFNEANQGYRYDSKTGDYVTYQMDANGTDYVYNKDGLPASKKITIPYSKDANGNLLQDSDGKPVSKEYALNKFVDYDDPEVWAELPKDVRDTLVGDTGKMGSEAVEAYLEKHNGIFDGGNLFSNHGDSDDDTDITASNISISYSWSKGDMIVRSFACSEGAAEAASGDSSNILHLENLYYEKQDYVPNTLVSSDQSSSSIMFTGTFGEMWDNIGTVLGNDQKLTTDHLNNYYKNSVSIDTSRDSVSSVDFNDEAMNLMMYAKSYNAACRLMTTLDSVLDKLVNGTGMTT